MGVACYHTPPHSLLALREALLLLSSPLDGFVWMEFLLKCIPHCHWLLGSNCRGLLLMVMVRLLAHKLS